MPARKWCSGFDEKDEDCARKLMAAILEGRVFVDWDEFKKVAESPKYRCWDEVEAVRREVEDQLAKSQL